MLTHEGMRKGAERIIQIRKIFEEKGKQITDQTALGILEALESHEIIDDDSFQRMVEYAFHLYMMKFTGEGVSFRDDIGEKAQVVIGELENIPELERNKNIEQVWNFEKNLKEYFRVSSDAELGELLGVTRQAVNGYFKAGYLTKGTKKRLKASLKLSRYG